MPVYVPTAQFRIAGQLYQRAEGTLAEQHAGTERVLKGKIWLAERDLDFFAFSQVPGGDDDLVFVIKRHSLFLSGDISRLEIKFSGNDPVPDLNGYYRVTGVSAMPKSGGAYLEIRLRK